MAFLHGCSSSAPLGFLLHATPPPPAPGTRLRQMLMAVQGDLGELRLSPPREDSLPVLFSRAGVFITLLMLSLLGCFAVVGMQSNHPELPISAATSSV